MQNRKDLAEAGRRKLEEFRKAKAQGKAVTTAPLSKFSQDAVPPPPPTRNAGPLQLQMANGNGKCYSTSYSAVSAAAPGAPPRLAVDSISPPAYSTPNAGPTTSTPSVAQPREQSSSAPPAPVTQPSSAAPSSTLGPNPASGTQTTFVVLQDAPIPFGSSPAAPAAQGPQTNGSGFLRISANGGPLQSWSEPSVAQAIRGVETSTASMLALAQPTDGSDLGPGAGQAPMQQLGTSAGTAAAAEPRSNVTSALPWESSYGFAQFQKGVEFGNTAANGPVGSVATRLSDDAAFFGDSLSGKEPCGQASQAGESSLSSTGHFGVSAAGASSLSSLFGAGPTDSGSRPQHVLMPASNVVAPQPALPSAATTNSLDRHGVGQSDWKVASSNKTDKVWDYNSSHTAPVTQAVAEPKAQPDATRLDAHSGAAASGHSLGAGGMEVVCQASVSPDSGPLSRPPDWRPLQPKAGDSAETVPPPPAAATAAAAVPLYMSTSTATGYGWAAEVRQPDTRPPWLAYSAATAPSVTAQSAALFEAPSSTVTPAIGALSSGVYEQLTSNVPQPTLGPLSSVANEAGGGAASSLSASLWPAGSMGAAGPATTSNSAPVAAAATSSFPYEQLSDSYLSTSDADTAAGALDALSKAAGPITPPVPQEGQSRPSELWSNSAAAEGLIAASPTVPFSAGAGDGIDSHVIPRLAAPPLTATVGPAVEQPSSQPEPFLVFPSYPPSAAASTAEVPAPPPPARSVPPPSRFAWLFGSPTPAKQQPSSVLQQFSAAAAAAAPLQQQQFTVAPNLPLPLPVQPTQQPGRADPAPLPTQPRDSTSPVPAPQAPLPGSTHEAAASQAAAPVAEDIDSLSSTTRPALGTSYISPSAHTWGGPGAHEAHPQPPSNTLSYGAAPEQHSSTFRTDRAPVFGSSSSSSFGLAGGLEARDTTGPQLPSFLRGVDWTSAGREDRSAVGSGTALLLSAGSLGQSEDAMPASGAVSEAAPAEFATIPSFSTSFPPVPLDSLPQLSQAAAAPRPQPAGDPSPTTAVNTGSMPYFSTVTNYLSAYGPSAVGDDAASHGASAIGAAANTSSTSSFLESYLDNLLSTMSAAPSRVGVEDPHAQLQSHVAGRAEDPSAGMYTADRGGAGQSSAGTSRHSHRADASADAGGVPSGRHAGPGFGSEGAEEGLGSGGGGGGNLGGGAMSAGDLVAGGVTDALPHVDNVAQLRSQQSRSVSVDSAGVLSVHSQATVGMHMAGANAHGPGGGSSGISRAQFAALQQHIDELTEEKLALMRGLQQQTRINEQLAEENEELMRQYNARGAVMEELQRKMKQYEQELEAQTLSLEGFSEERQAARSSYVEASSRAQTLAAEVVSLEAQVLQLKSAVLKAERTAEEAQQRARKLEKQVEVLTREAQERAQELQQTQLKGRNLVVKLKQTEAKLEAAEEKLAVHAALAGVGLHGVLPNGHPPPAAPVPSPKPPTAEQEVQCDLASKLAAVVEAPPQSDAGDGSTSNLRSEDVAMAIAADNRQDRTADGASTIGSALADAPGAGSLALVRHPSAAVSTDIPDTPDQLLRADSEAVPPQRDAPSTVVAERALASLDEQALRAAARGRLPEGLDAVALQLARWLPAGPVSGGDPMAVMVEEELRLMQSIYELLENFEQAQDVTARQVVELQARVVSLTSENNELRHKLELQTQRLELQMQGMTTGQPLSLHQTPAAASAAPVEGLAGTTPVSGPHVYQPAQPFLPEPESAVVTPTRSTRMSTLTSMESPAPTGPPSKRTWMGYLFRSRQKKRTRSAIL